MRCACFLLFIQTSSPPFFVFCFLCVRFVHCLDIVNLINIWKGTWLLMSKQWASRRWTTKQQIRLRLNYSINEFIGRELQWWLIHYVIAHRLSWTTQIKYDFQHFNVNMFFVSVLFIEKFWVIRAKKVHNQTWTRIYDDFEYRQQITGIKIPSENNNSSMLKYMGLRREKIGKVLFQETYHLCECKLFRRLTPWFLLKGNITL